MKDELIELSKLRISLNKTRKEICQKIGCAERSLLSWEQGKFTPSPVYQTKIKALIKQLRDIEFQENSGAKIKAILLDVIGSGWFQKDIQLGGEKAFLMWRVLRLSSLEKHLGGSIYDPIKIVRCIESLAREGRLKCFAIRADGVNDFLFYIEIGSGDFSNWDLPFQPQIKRLYRENPLSESELKKPEVTLSICQICDKFEAERRQYFESQYGRPLKVEQQISHDNYLDSIEKRDRENRLLEGIEKLGRKNNG